MTGTIKSFLEDKQFGFINGDDKKDYFFHKSSVDNKESICDGAIVSFDTKATAKGYSAVKIKIEKLSDAKYNVPDEIYTSKTSSIKGWETIVPSEWVIFASSRNSPEDAKRIAFERAAYIGANALVRFEYFKETQSELSDSGKGTYYFSVHNFRGVAVNIGKKNANGKFTKNDFPNINKMATKRKKDLSLKTSISNQRTTLTFIISLILLAISGLISFSTEDPNYIFVTGIIFAIMLFTVKSTNYDDWLIKTKKSDSN